MPNAVRHKRPLDLHAGIHISSVHPELGSNSQIIYKLSTYGLIRDNFKKLILSNSEITEHLFLYIEKMRNGSLCTPHCQHRANFEGAIKWHDPFHFP